MSTQPGIRRSTSKCPSPTLGSMEGRAGTERPGHGTGPTWQLWGGGSPAACEQGSPGRSTATASAHSPTLLGRGASEITQSIAPGADEPTVS